MATANNLLQPAEPAEPASLSLQNRDSQSPLQVCDGQSTLGNAADDGPSMIGDGISPALDYPPSGEIRISRLDAPKSTTSSERVDARAFQNGTHAPVAPPGEQRSRATKSNDRPVTALGNPYELHIFPDEHSIVNDCLLIRTPYIINTKYVVLICTDCRHCVNPDRAVQHLRQEHPHCKVSIDFNTSLNTRFPGLVTSVIHPIEIIEPVFGLAISIEEYTVCTRCRRGYVDVNTWRRHVCEKADVNLEGHPAYFHSHVQTFFRAPRVHYFPVKFPLLVLDETLGRRDDFGLFKSEHQDFAVCGDTIEEPDDYRELNQFLLKEGWIKHVSGYPRSEISSLTAPPMEGDFLKPIAVHVVSLTSNIQAAIGAAGYHVRRLLGKRPA